ncbi:hypothetical protein Y032_0012g1722 [Ancylostoma ceylanicum]|uniref:Uncharacterized protein n=1 Tax=Ancylostoma ceylanicum TaxID=53326 RepID=A0A016VBW7_9BILA|nr:hypothetical protein Y032_0012g1722 [Ancylostoma ceylanicum]
MCFSIKKHNDAFRVSLHRFCVFCASLWIKRKSQAVSLFRCDGSHEARNGLIEPVLVEINAGFRGDGHCGCLSVVMGCVHLVAFIVLVNVRYVFIGYDFILQVLCYRILSRITEFVVTPLFYCGCNKAQKKTNLVLNCTVLGL